MDPQDPTSFNHRTERIATGQSYHFVDQLPENYDSTINPTLLCVHGFPDLWYGWRYQIGPWTAKGYRVVVPDMLGYGSTDAPSDAHNYTSKSLCDDLASLLDLIGIKKAVLIGHDWGSFIVGRFALWYPDRLLALSIISVPFTPPAPVYVPIEEVAKRVPDLSYQVYFANPKSTSEIDANLLTFLKVTYNRDCRKYVRDPQPIIVGKKADSLDLECMLNNQELEYYYSQFKRGMHGPLSYYRTGEFRFEEERTAQLRSTVMPGLPVLFVWGSEDPISTHIPIQRLRKWIPQVQDICLEGKGHWMMVEAKEIITETVLQWLEDSLLRIEPKTRL